MRLKIRVVGVPPKPVRDVIVTLAERASVHDVACALEPNRGSGECLTLELLPPQGNGSGVLLPPQVRAATLNLASGLTVRVREAATGGSPTVLPTWATANRVAPITRMFHPHVPSAGTGDEPEPATLVFREPPAVQRFPVTALLLPLIAGVMLFVLTRSQVSLVMALLTPLAFLANIVWGRVMQRRFRGQERRRLEHQLDDVSGRFDTYRREMESLLHTRFPSTRALCRMVTTAPEHVWWAPVDEKEGVALRLGETASVLASLREWVKRVALQGSDQASAEHVTHVREKLRCLQQPSRVPHVIQLRPGTRIGVVGSEEGRLAILNDLVMQLAVRCSPTMLRMHAEDRPELRELNRILSWLPHSASHPSKHSVAQGLDVVVALGGAVHRRELFLARTALVMVADHVAALPPDCDAVIVADEGQGLFFRQPVGSGASWVEEEFTLQCADQVECELAAMRLAGLLPRDVAPVAAGNGATAQEVFPPSVAFLEPEAHRWEVSMKAAGGDGGLQATVGVTSQGPFTLDLRAQGPHALVGGTTGSGKSEFLQTWVLALAASHPPTRVNFLFVDYKGGAAFAECTRLPHAVGLVTDLTPHLARRALVSLRAELTAREELLLRKRAKRIEDLERDDDPDTPPALVIVVDEFAALSAEVPEFVDGVLDIAQRGRSLGFHLILATQRPAGVVTSNLRANTNLRVALRTADEGDSVDVIGTNWAAHFPQDRPGRAAMVTGSGTPTLFQSAYVGAPPESEPLHPVTVADLHRSSECLTVESETPHVSTLRVSSVQERVVETLIERARTLGLPPPRRPWIEPLAPVYDLTKLRQRTDSELLLGVVDQPNLQHQGTHYFEPERDGHVAVVGASGAGKSCALRTLVIAAGITPRGGPVHVYGIDCGAGGLAPVVGLPHVASIVRGDSTEGVRRTFQHLGEMLDDRHDLFQQAGVEKLSEYRRLGEEAQKLPRILLLIDDLAVFRAEWEHHPAGVYATLARILASGRNAGIHVAITASRGQELPATILSQIGCRVVLRQSDDDGYTVLGVPRGILTDEVPPGRGIIDGAEVQIAVIGGTPNLHEQREAITHLSRVIAAEHPVPAQPLRMMPEKLTTRDVPRSVGGRPVLGLRESTLEPVAFEASGVLRIAAEDTATLHDAVMWIIGALGRAGVSGSRTLMDAGSRSPFTDTPTSQIDALFDRVIKAPAEIAEALEEFTSATAPGNGCVVLTGLRQLAHTEVEDTLRTPIGVRLTDRQPRGTLCIVAATTKEWSGHYGIVGSLKEIARGLIVQPGPHDGEQVFGVRLPPPASGNYPPGRAVAVSGSETVEVQLGNDGWAMTGSARRDWVI